MTQVLGEVSYTSLTHDFVQTVSSTKDGAEVAIILIGSVARSTQTSNSDLDLLLVGGRVPQITRNPDRLHVQALTTKQFEERLRAGDDFAAWCVRYGVPLVNSSDWLRIVGSPEASIWPDWRKKVRHAARRLTIAASLLETGDIPAAWEEMLYAASHTARAILLKNSAFPLSRPEIISQLREVKCEYLAKLLQELSYEEATKLTLDRGVMYIKRLLVSLDRTAYEEFVHKRKQNARAKSKVRASR